MTLRRFYSALVLAALASPGAATAANFETPNFSVEAPTPELARKFGEMAEAYRKEKALDWLGHEMPQWPRKCPLQVQVSMGSAGGATTFTFGSDQGRPVVSSQRMEIRGDAKQLLYSVLPHEVTHTVLAHHFGRPVPRWADEGGSVLSENDEERFSHDVRCREILNAGRAFVLRTLFRMTEYPRDMTVLYAQGYSVTAYLVEKGGNGREGRGKLLQFLGGGMNGNTAESWNEAARKVYGFESIDALERAWLDALRTPPSRLVARGAAPGNDKPAATHASTAAATGTPRTELRTSAAPAMPLLEPPVRAVRGVAPANEPTRPAAAPTAPSYPPPVLGPPELPRTR
ncbi:hypothetical protein [Gemmata sp.]|uniref:hypothetical protein n=1 Tax=Gemmata sp. TaxID=1914242 RepID=UPI003F721F6A